MKEISNAIISSADLTMADHGCLVLWLMLEGDGWGCGFGGRVLGKGYVGADKFLGYSSGIEEIMRIMDVVGVSNFSELEGKMVRVETPSAGGSINKIGNAIKDKWFDYDEFYSNT